MWIPFIFLRKCLKSLGNFLVKNRVLISLYFIALIFSFLINFAIDILVYDNEILSKVGFYFYTNIPVQVSMTLAFLFSVIYFNGAYWKNKFKLRILLEVLTILFITFLIMLFLALYVSEYHNPIELFKNFRSIFSQKYFYTTCIESLIIVLFLEIAYMFIKTQKDELKYEKMKYDNERFKYNQLKSQINPHFLFNSFNVLNEMLYVEKPEKSSEYVCALSEFYRYVLASQEHDTVLLKDELEFIDHFIEVLTIRYSNNLILVTNVNETDLEKKVVPMTLQILIENAVKHNIISKKSVLIVNITSDNGYLIVSNIKRLRKDKVYSTGIGLNNLIETYKLFSEKRVLIINDDINFIVKVPLI